MTSLFGNDQSANIPSSGAIYQRQRSHELLRRGLCTRCMKMPFLEGKKHCRLCLAKNKTRRKKVHDKRKNNDLCVACGKAKLRHGALCVNCLTEQNRTRSRKKKSGVCLTCDLPATMDSLYCQRHREYHKAKSKQYYQELRREVFDAYGGPRCACCGETTWEFLELDHIFGDGRKHRETVGGTTTQVYRSLRKNGFPPGFQVLCSNCNHAKGIYGCCPHEKNGSYYQI